jgi:hypothetical protein
MFGQASGPTGRLLGRCDGFGGQHQRFGPCGKQIDLPEMSNRSRRSES